MTGVNAGPFRFRALWGVYSLTLTVYALATVSLGNVLVAPYVPALRPDAAAPLRLIVKVQTFLGTLTDMVVPGSVVGVLAIAAAAWLLQYALASTTAVVQRSVAGDLARERGIAVSEVRFPRDVRRREAGRLARLLLKLGVMYAVAGGLLALIGWALVAVVNYSAGTWVHVTAAAISVVLLLLLAWAVVLLRDMLVVTEPAQESYDRWT